MNNNLFYLSLPISMNVVALSSISGPVSIQQSLNNENTYTFDNTYGKYTDPVKTDFISLIEKRINSIKYLETNWDGYGGDAPDEKVINNSIQFVSKLPGSLQSEIKPEKVIATPYGTIVFDFERNQNLISIEVGEKNIGFFSEFSDRNNISVDKTSFNSNNLPVELIAAFHKLYL
jgi:hypothetical protein